MSLKINDIVELTFKAKNLLYYYNRNIPESYTYGVVKDIKYNSITKRYVIEVCWDHIHLERTYFYTLEDLVVRFSPR